MAGPLLEVKELTKLFAGAGIVARSRTALRAVDRVSFAVEPGTVFGLVGESGCGKTTLARALLYLDPPTSGEVLFRGTSLGALSRRDLRSFRKRLQIVFQDPTSALDPQMSVRSSLEEGLVNLRVPAGERRRRIGELLELVGIQPDAARRFPHEFSSGQKQRATIARALSMKPELLVLDEPVSNLDVSIQAQIINLLLDIKDRLALTYLFISHDLNLVAYLSDRIAVMFRGRIVELGSTYQILGGPLHPYTRRLFSAVPRLTGEGVHWKMGPEGEKEAPRPGTIAGCRYFDRCAAADLQCSRLEPELTDAGGGHMVACLKGA